MSLRERELVGELMDDPSLNPEEHALALRGLARLNRMSAAGAPFVRAFGSMDCAGEVSILDVACGSGDVLTRTIACLRKRGIDAVGAGCDVSAFACAQTKARAERAGVPVRVFTQDALASGAVEGAPYDGVMNSLFLHHLTNEDAAHALRAMARALRPGGLLVVSDLLRTRMGYAMAAAASRLVTRSRVVHTDALRSVRAAFTLHELRELCADAGLDAARVERVWPERGVITWTKPA